jgi:hypothetical protein
MKNSLFYTYIFLFCGFSLSAQTLNLMYYVSAIPGEHGMWVSRQKANETWFRGDKVLIDGVFDGNGVDPDIFKQQDGSLRLYYFQGYFVTPPPQNPGPNPIYSAVSTDGVRFTGKRKVFEYNNVFDPSDALSLFGFRAVVRLLWSIFTFTFTLSFCFGFCRCFGCFALGFLTITLVFFIL